LTLFFDDEHLQSAVVQTERALASCAFHAAVSVAKKESMQAYRQEIIAAQPRVTLASRSRAA